jgi:putative transposase
MKNIIKFDNYFSQRQLEEKLKEFVHYYNFERYHESLQNVTPSEVYLGTANRKIKQRKTTKKRTLVERKKQY